MAGGQEGDTELVAASLECLRLIKAQRVLDAFAAHPCAHQPRRRFAQNDFAVVGRMVGVRVTDEDQLLFRPMRIEPKAQVRKMDSALPKLEFECRHGWNLAGDRVRRKASWGCYPGRKISSRHSLPATIRFVPCSLLF